LETVAPKELEVGVTDSPIAEANSMGEKTRKNVYDAFVGEAKAHHRLLAFARKADEEEYPHVAKLFRAVAAAEGHRPVGADAPAGVHVERHLRLLGEAVVKSTEENLQFSFESETTVNQVYYPRFISEAEAEEERAAERETPDRCPVCNAERERFRLME